MEDNRTANRDYLLPSPLNKMRSEDVPRLIAALAAIDGDVAALFAALADKASAVHTHEMAEIIGLVSALAGKAPAVHSHSIGSLTGANLADAAANQFLGFNGTLWIPTSIATVHLANKIITNAKLRDSDPLTVIGRASASLGTPGDISATANDRILARVADVLGFVQMTLGMIPDGLLTFDKLAGSARATPAEVRAWASAKLLAAEAVKLAAAFQSVPAGTSWTPNLQNGWNWRWSLIGHSTLGLPANMFSGQELRVLFKQPASGGPYTMTWPSSSKLLFPGSSPVLSTAAGAVDMLIGTVEVDTSGSEVIPGNTDQRVVVVIPGIGMGAWAGGSGEVDLYTILADLGLASGLITCLDAGSSKSYDGTSQVWKDLSPNGGNFNRGTGNSSDAADPTFNGVAGRFSEAEFFSFDGGDYFTEAQTAWGDDTFARANVDMSYMFISYLPSITAAHYLFSNQSSQTSQGTTVLSRSTGKLSCYVGNGASGDVEGHNVNSVVGMNFLGLNQVFSSSKTHSAEFVVNATTGTASFATGLTPGTGNPAAATIGRGTGVTTPSGTSALRNGNLGAA